MKKIETKSYYKKKLIFIYFYLFFLLNNFIFTFRKMSKSIAKQLFINY